MPARRGSKVAVKAPGPEGKKATKRSNEKPKPEAVNGTVHEEPMEIEASEAPSIQGHAKKNGATPRSMQEPAISKKRKREPSGTSLSPVPRQHTQAGWLFVCGQGDSGQLGLGNMNEEDDMGEVARPRISPLSDQNPKVVQVAAGGMHSVALTERGEVYTTGVNDEAALGRKTDTTIYNSVKGSTGDAFKWGLVDVPQDLGQVVEVSAGDSHTAALTELGAVFSWGVFRGNSGPYAFLPGQDFALQPVLVYKPDSAQSQILRISSGADHVLAMRRDGAVLSWGFGEQGQLGRLGSRMRNPEDTMLHPGLVPLHNIQGLRGRAAKAVGIAAGTFGSFVMTSTGHTVAFGVNASGQLGVSTEGGRVDHNLITRPKLVSSLEGQSIAAIGAGKAHTLALTKEGAVYSFGLQTYGRLGRKEADTSSDKHLGPGRVAIPGDEPVASVAAGADTSAVVTSQGEAFVFGLGTNKQLTRASDDDAELPWKVKREKFVADVAANSVLQIAMGGQHTLLLAD